MENSRSRLGKQYCPINIVLVCANRCYGEGSGNPQSTGHLNLALKKKKSSVLTVSLSLPLFICVAA